MTAGRRLRRGAAAPDVYGTVDAQDVPAAVPDARKLARSAASGTRWGLLSNLVHHLGRVVFTLVLARMVGPDDFGVVAQATIFIGFTQLLLDQGFGAALIQKRTLDRLDVGSVFWLNLVTAAVMAGVTVLVAPLVADFFDTPEITQVLRVLAVVVLLYGLTVVPMSMVNRHLRFKSMAVVDMLGVLLGGVAGVAHAAAGGGYWAIVTQTVVSAVVTLVGLLRVNGLPPMRGSFARLRALFSFSAGLFGARLVQYAGSHGDNLLVGRFLGKTDLAFYALGYRMLTLPIQTFGRIVNQVAFPVFSRLQDQPERIRSWFLLSTRATAMAVYPVLTLAMLTIPLLVPLVLGDAWRPAIVPMMLFTAVAYRAVVLKLVGPLFMSAGRTSTIFRISLLEVGLVLLGASVGLRWGITGVAAGILAARYAVSPVILSAAGRVIDLKRREYLLVLLPVWVACAAMAGSWLAVRSGLEAAGAPVAAAALSATVVGSAVYLLLVRFVFVSAWRDGLKVAAMVAGRRRGAPVAPAGETDGRAPAARRPRSTEEDRDVELPV